MPNLDVNTDPHRNQSIGSGLGSLLLIPVSTPFPQSQKTLPRPGSLGALLSTLDADEGIRGKQFELICKWYLENDPKYRAILDNVWTWAEWPGRWGIDAGIDLVARTKAGTFWAIQAKCYRPDRSITKSDIDSFLTESSRSIFSHRLLIATTNLIGQTASRTLDGQEKPVGNVLLSDLDSPELSWPQSVTALLSRSHSSVEQAVPRNYQAEAVAACVSGFKESDRGKLLHPCGTGKTLTAKWIHDAMKSQVTLVLEPTLTLLDQTLRTWIRSSENQFDFIMVCSNSTLRQPGLENVASLGVPCTTDPITIQGFLKTDRSRPAVVFSTYHSAHAVSAAQAGTDLKFDLGIFDEAHVCAGLDDSLFTQPVNQNYLRIEKRLFTTATPRIFTESVKSGAEQKGLKIVSLDDPAWFGPVFHKMSFRQAIEKKILSDYQVVITIVTNSDVQALITSRALVTASGAGLTDARNLAVNLAILKAIHKFDLKKLISFHSTIEAARAFSDPTGNESITTALKFLPDEAKPQGEFWTGHINSSTGAHAREGILRMFGDLPLEQRAVISNCDCLGIGFDEPRTDSIVFVDPKSSEIDIVQAVGRVMRRAPGKTIGTIVVPVFVEDTTDVEEALQSSEFSKVWKILRAIRAHDELLSQKIEQFRINKGRANSSPGKENVDVFIDLPAQIPEEFERALSLRLVNMADDLSQYSASRDEIIAWAMDHYTRTGSMPLPSSGKVFAKPDWRWQRVDRVIRSGAEHFGSCSGLVDFLSRELPSKCFGPPPHGWLTRHQVSEILEVSNDTVRKMIAPFRSHSPAYFQKFRTPSGLWEHLSPDLVETLRSQVPPTGWLTPYNLSYSCNVAGTGVVAFADRFRSSNPNWFKYFYTYSGSWREHFAPELVSKIKRAIQLRDLE